MKYDPSGWSAAFRDGGPKVLKPSFAFWCGLALLLSIVMVGTGCARCIIGRQVAMQPKSDAFEMRCSS